MKMVMLEMLQEPEHHTAGLVLDAEYHRVAVGGGSNLQGISGEDVEFSDWFSMPIFVVISADDGDEGAEHGEEEDGYHLRCTSPASDEDDDGAEHGEEEEEEEEEEEDGNYRQRWILRCWWSRKRRRRWI
ncbi:hypothetical protein LXL04_000861 [Taraxacum kok-saghyz]